MHYFFSIAFTFACLANSVVAQGNPNVMRDINSYIPPIELLPLQDGTTVVVSINENANRLIVMRKFCKLGERGGIPAPIRLVN